MIRLPLSRVDFFNRGETRADLKYKKKNVKRTSLQRAIS